MRLLKRAALNQQQPCHMSTHSSAMRRMGDRASAPDRVVHGAHQDVLVPHLQEERAPSAAPRYSLRLAEDHAGSSAEMAHRLQGRTGGCSSHVGQRRGVKVCTVSTMIRSPEGTA